MVLKKCLLALIISMLLIVIAPNAYSILGSNFLDYGVDVDGNGLYDYLTIEEVANVTEASKYRVKYDVRFLNEKDFGFSKDFFLPAEPSIIHLNISGARIFEERQNGSLILQRVRIFNGSNTSQELDEINPNYVTAFYNYTDFERTEKTISEAVLINEVLPDSSFTGTNDKLGEWIELFNNESFAINIEDWNISDASASAKNFTIGDISIPPRGFVVLVFSIDNFNSIHPNVIGSGIKVIEYGASDIILNNDVDAVFLYDNNGNLVDKLAYSNPKANISIGRYPDGSPQIFNLSTLTPGAKNDRLAPILNKWINPSSNNTKVSGLVNITVNITDDTTQVNSTIVNFNNTNFSMAKNGDLWTFLWNTSLNAQKLYNITVLFNDSYGKSGFDTLFNITVNNSPFIINFSPSNLNQVLEEGSTLTFIINASDPDDNFLNISWFLDNVLNASDTAAFNYNPDLDDSGTHTVNVTIKDSVSNHVSLKWTVVVTNFNRAPILEQIADKAISKNTNLSFNITASDIDDDALTFSSNHSSIAISKINNSLATVSWKPTNLDLGDNAINFTVSDGSLTDSKVITIDVNAEGNKAPTIISSPSTSGAVDELYSYDVDAADEDNDTLRFSLKTNASGMAINFNTGLITFTPSLVGVFEVNASVTDLIETANQSYVLVVELGNPLKITDVDVKVDGKKSSNVKENSKISKEAKPGSNVEFKITVKNNFLESDNIKIEDIKVETTIEDIDDGSDLEEESNEFDLNEQDDKTVTLKFKLPLNIEEGDFDVVIHAEGEDENGNVYERDFKIELEVEKEKHDLRFQQFELSPAIVSCARAISARYKLINLGQEDEENAVLEIKSDSLGLNFAQKGISIGEGTEDNILSKFTNLKINENAESGDYQAIANVYSDDGKLRDTKTTQVKVVDCVKTKASGEVVLLVGQEKEKSISNKNIQSIRTPIQKPIVKTTSADADADSNLILLLISTAVFTIFFVAIAIILVIAA